VSKAHVGEEGADADDAEDRETGDAMALSGYSPGPSGIFLGVYDHELVAVVGY